MSSVFHVDKPDSVIRSIAQTIGYTGRKFQVRTTESVTLSDNYWSGGTRSYWYFFSLGTGKQVSLPGQNPLQDANTHSVELPPDVLAVEHAIFCGKDMGLTVWAHPSAMDRMALPAAPELSPEESIVLYTTRAYKASYGGVSNLRQKESGLPPEAYERAKQSLIEKRLLNKRGAITPAGRNAASERDPRVALRKLQGKEW